MPCLLLNSELSSSDTFNKIVGLRETERKLQLQTEEQEMKVIEQENIIRELESALEHIKLQCDRQLTLQHKEHEKKTTVDTASFQGTRW